MRTDWQNVLLIHFKEILCNFCLLLKPQLQMKYFCKYESKVQNTFYFMSDFYLVVANAVYKFF